MPVKISLGLNKKVGLPNYSSLGANCQVECELDNAVVQEGPERFQAEAERLFDLCREAVEEELARETATNGKPYAAANGFKTAGGRPAHSCASEASHDVACPPASESELADIGLTERQLKFIQDLATQIHGLGIRRLPALVAIQFDKNLTELTSVEASRLIGLLRQVRSGSLRLEPLLEQDAPEA
jgi:hypothetical protein